MDINKKIAIVGAGNLGRSIAIGLIKSQITKAENVVASRRNLKTLIPLEDLGAKITSDNREAVNGASVVFLCVQPKQVNAVIKEIESSISKETLIVSVITGVLISELDGMFLTSKPKIIRAMPNTTIAIGESMTCIAGTDESEGDLEFVKKVFDELGQTLIIQESLMKAATVLGASGIAFFMRYLRAATQGGVQMGFHPEEAQAIAVQTALGASKLLQENGRHPEEEIDFVTTPRGCTIEGLNEMEHQGFSSALIKGLVTSYNKINSISK